MKDNFVVNEIFNSIDGEGTRAGSLATFIRLAGCNIRCSYCDTSYSLKATDGKIMMIDEIISEVSKYNCKHITLTGGEPLIHNNCILLVKKLIDSGYIVNIETNGTLDISEYLIDNCIITMDYKTPSSKMEHKMYIENLDKLRENDVLKFVCSRSDLERVREVILNNNFECWIYLSPVFNQIEVKELVYFIKQLDEEIDTEKIRVQVQLHKVIWDSKERGV